ncbi:MAG: hypothetical protein IH888_13140 [Planctomycetes bacterium]|nr:hypothetical protein [Planctomycetota bacterium]
MLVRFLVALSALSVGAGLPGQSATEPEAGSASYRTHAQLSGEIVRLVSEYAGFCSAESIATSREGRSLWALRLALEGEVDPDRRSALLLAANIDGDHLIGSEVALQVAASLLTMARQADDAAVRFLTEHTLYIVPRVNPDAAERFFSEVKMNRRRTMRPDDADRDGEIDEDPPDDLNGDGLITMMRVLDLEKADMMPDPADERLDVKPDRDKGERARYTLYVEGTDDDGDGEYNEDDVGGVDLNMNFMHGYQEHADGAGPHQVSEPESLGLLQYVLAHQNIAVVLTYGRHDNLSEPPSEKGTYPSGAPKTIDAKDAGLYKQISERFQEITGLKKVPNVPDEGAFFAWAYAQFGVPSFTTPLWHRPEPAKEEEEDPDQPDAEKNEDQAVETEGDEDAGGTPSGVGDITQETIDELRAAAEDAGFEVSDEMIAQITPAQVEQFAKQMNITVRRVKAAAKEDPKAKNAEDAAWLKYSDEQRAGTGFVDWQTFDHPQLGAVEIGGWAPYFKTNPPPQEIAVIAEKQVEFILDLAGRFPTVTLSKPKITRLAEGLYEVKAALVNDGYLPTGTAMAIRNRRARPYVVRLSTPNPDILTGRRVNKTWSIPGSGGREPYRWIIRAADDSKLTITVFSEKFGEFKTIVTLQEQEQEQTPEAGGAS